jgi:hypothetical protein
MELWRRLASRREISIIGGLIVLGIATIAIRLLDGGAVMLHSTNRRAHGTAVAVTAAKAIRQNVPENHRYDRHRPIDRPNDHPKSAGPS